MELKGRLHGPRLMSLQIIAPSRAPFQRCLSQMGVFSRGLFNIFWAAAATLFIRAMQMFNETGGTSAGNKRRHGLTLLPCWNLPVFCFQSNRVITQVLLHIKTSRPCTHAILALHLRHSARNSLSKATSAPRSVPEASVRSMPRALRRACGLTESCQSPAIF